MKQDKSLHLTLFVVNKDKHKEMIDTLNSLLKEHYDDDAILDIIDVLALPMKAVENDVFATPMLIREVPDPVLKVLINISSTRDVFLAVSANGGSDRALL